MKYGGCIDKIMVIPGDKVIRDGKVIDKIPIQYTVGQYKHNSPTTKEQIYYRDLFEKYYTGIGNVIPYFWMPKYLNATDPSARTLQVYYECNPELNERAV